MPFFFTWHNQVRSQLPLDLGSRALLLRTLHIHTGQSTRPETAAHSRRETAFPLHQRPALALCRLETTHDDHVGGGDGMAKVPGQSSACVDHPCVVALPQ